MKVMTLTLGFALVAASTQAAPLYVGENVTPTNNITLGFQETPVKKTGTTAGTKTANIAAVELKAGFIASENISTKLGLPMYFASKNLTGTSRNTLGNVSLGLGWNDQMWSSDKQWNYGYNVNADVFLPTSRKVQGSSVALVNPTTEFFKYDARSTAILPTVGAFAGQDMWSAKATVGVAYQYATGLGRTDKNRFGGIGQLGTSFHALPNLHLNAEYNTIFMDKAMRGTSSSLRSAFAPSVSGNYDSILGNVYASIPLDKPTRRATNVAFGANVGYMF